MQAFIFKILSYLPGIINEEVDVTLLLSTVAEAEMSHGFSVSAAVVAIETKADTIFKNNDWFKSLALSLLHDVASVTPAPTPKPAA